MAVPQKWSTGLYDCCADDTWAICCTVCNATCVGYGIEHDKVHHKGCTTPACVWCLSYFICLPFCYLGPKLRKEVRGQYNLPAEPCGDCMVHFCCHPCAVCQEWRELEKRENAQGMQPAGGAVQNVHMQGNKPVATDHAPPAHAPMTRIN